MKQLHPVILKLGGSILSEKRAGKPLLRSAHIRRLARVLAAYRRTNPDVPILLLHGAGSFGHPIAHRYRYHHEPLTLERVRGMGQSLHAVRLLADAMNTILLSHRLPILPLQTSAMMSVRDGKLICHQMDLLTTVLHFHAVPVFGGDVVIDEHAHTAIASADTIAVLLARAFPGSRLLFATDVEGVYSQFPPKKGELPVRRLTRSSLRSIIEVGTEEHTRFDVTGSMIGKLRSLLPLRNIEAVIFNGNDPHTLDRALRGKAIGTTVQL